MRNTQVGRSGKHFWILCPIRSTHPLYSTIVLHLSKTASFQATSLTNICLITVFPTAIIPIPIYLQYFPNFLKQKTKTPTVLLFFMFCNILLLPLHNVLFVHYGAPVSTKKWCFFWNFGMVLL